MYVALKVIHIIAVILFMGNIITGLFWKAHVDRTRNVKFIAHTMDGLIRADRWFTIPGVIVITAAGIFAAIQAGLPLLRTGWILWSIIAFSAGPPPAVSMSSWRSSFATYARPRAVRPWSLARLSPTGTGMRSTRP